MEPLTEPTLLQNVMSGNIPVGAILGLLGLWGVWKVGGKGAGLLAKTCAKFSVGCVMACVMILGGLAGTGYSIGELVAQPDKGEQAEEVDHFSIDHLSKEDLLTVAKTTGDPDKAVASIIKYLKFQEDQNRRIDADRNGDKKVETISHQVVQSGDKQFILINTGAEIADSSASTDELSIIPDDLLSLKSAPQETPQEQPWMPVQFVWLTMLTSVGLIAGGVTTYFSS